VRKFILGDTVWVATPKLPAERRAGTITRIDKRGDQPRYTIEWETYVDETDGKSVRYWEREIVLAKHS
jgi:Domain of unknown function (DUF1918)